MGKNEPDIVERVLKCINQLKDVETVQLVRLAEDVVWTEEIGREKPEDQYRIYFDHDKLELEKGINMLSEYPDPPDVRETSLYVVPAGYWVGGGLPLEHVGSPEHALEWAKERIFSKQYEDWYTKPISSDKKQ